VFVGLRVEISNLERILGENKKFIHVINGFNRNFIEFYFKKFLTKRKRKKIVLREKELLFWLLKRQPKENKRRHSKSLHR